MCKCTQMCAPWYVFEGERVTSWGRFFFCHLVELLVVHDFGLMTDVSSPGSPGIIVNSIHCRLAVSAPQTLRL